MQTPAMMSLFPVSIAVENYVFPTIINPYIFVKTKFSVTQLGPNLNLVNIEHNKNDIRLVSKNQLSKGPSPNCG